MICLEQNPSTGALQPITPQPSDLSSCTLVAGSYTESSSPVWQLTEAQGETIGGAIFLAWSIAFGFRIIARFLLNDSERDES